jgi:hypothetical protein
VLAAVVGRRAASDFYRRQRHRNRVNSDKSTPPNPSILANFPWLGYSCGSCPNAWCNCDGLAIMISGGAGLVSRPGLAG